MLGNKKTTFKAQSAMEYLMTYGWAILIIAVVLGALFSLGIFSGASLLGTSCVASPGYLCQNPVLIPTGQLQFQFGQSTGATIYSVEFACAATANAAGLPGNSAAWYIIEANGVAYPSTRANNAPAIYNGISVPSGGTSQIGSGSGGTYGASAAGDTGGIPCYSSTGIPIGSAPIGSTSTATVGQSFSGSVWMNYTTAACTSTPCTWYTVKMATVTTKVV